MKIAVEPQRLIDAVQYDELVVVVGDDDGRPLMVLSVDREGRGLIEVDERDLAPAIRRLQALISAGVRAQLASVR